MEVENANASKMEVCKCVLVIGLDSDYRYIMINILSFYYGST